MSYQLPTDDLEHVLEHTRDIWDELKGGRLFVSGGTGFFGVWLLGALLHANERLALGAKAVVLTRSPEGFRNRAPEIAGNQAIQLHRGDCTSFEFPDGRFSHIFHAATETGALAPRDLFDSNEKATRRMLAFAEQCGTQNFLFTSSGAVYGQQPSDLIHLPETYPGAPSSLEANSAYGQSKRVSEFLCAAACGSELRPIIARCFAFVGPHLPLDANYAVGNFVRDALAGGPIHVNGDGSPYRSYLYAADLAIWLWTILIRGHSGRAYNIGSDAGLTIASLARLVSDVVNPKAEIVFARRPEPGVPPARYVPSIDRARNELGLAPWIEVGDGIKRMADHYRKRIL